MFLSSGSSRPDPAQRRPNGAPAVVNANGCREVTITIDGKANTYYPGSQELMALLKRLDP